VGPPQERWIRIEEDVDGRSWKSTEPEGQALRSMYYCYSIIS
jgi:hypothetical protein